MPKQRDIGDPLEQAATTGKIGGHLPPPQQKLSLPTRPLALPSENPGTQVPENPGTQGIRYSGTQELRGLGTRSVEPGTQVPEYPGTQGIESRNAKSSSAQYSRLGVYIPVDLHRRLKMYSVGVGRELSDIAIEAFLDYLARNEQPTRRGP